MAQHTRDHTAPTRPPFDTRPAQVEAWVASLPLANLGESSRLLFEALSQSNGQDVAADLRFRMLELIGIPLRTVVEGLKVHFVGKGIPLGDKARQIVQLTQTLMNLMGAGYRRVIEDGADKRGLLRDNRQAIVAVHRAITYHGQALLRAYQVYAPYPAGIWQRVHRLYQFAETQGFAQTAIKDDSPAADGTTTVEDAYKRILLLALACPYRLRQGEVEQVYHWLGEWARHATLSKLVETRNPNSLFVTNFETDDPPTYRVLRHTEQHPDACRLLNASRLADAIRDMQLPRQQDKRTPRQINEEALRRLMLAWGMMPKRRYTRARKESTAVVAMGLSTVHYFIGGDAVFDDARYGDGETLFNKPARFEAGELSDQQHLSDVWTMSDIHIAHGTRDSHQDTFGNQYIDFSTTETAKPKPAFAPIPRPTQVISYEMHEWKMVNVSAGGYRLLWDKNDDSQAHVGELLGLRESGDPDSIHLSLGVVRWMKQSAERGLELGVEMLSPGAVAVGTKIHKLGGGSEYMRSLLLPAVKTIGQPATLLTPALPYHVGDIVMVNSHGKEARVELTKLVENTGSFAQFQFRPLDSQSSVTPDSKPDPADDFSALWSQL